MLKLVRLFRIGRIISYMKFKSNLKIGFRVLQLLFFLLLLVHWIGCIWFIMVQERDSWMPPKDLDALFTDFYDKDRTGKYMTVFYYAILSILGNESAPVSITQTFFMSMIVILGAIVTAFIFGNMAALMNNLNMKDTHFQDQQDLVASTMRSIKLPEKLQDEVFYYLQYIYETPDIQQDLEKFF